MLLVTPKTLSRSSAILMGLMAGGLTAQEAAPESPPADDPVVEAATEPAVEAESPVVARASTLRGAPVHDATGQDVGWVHDFVIDDAGQLSVALLGRHGDDGEPATGLTGVPMSLLTFRGAEQVGDEGAGSILVATLEDTERLAMAPTVSDIEAVDARWIRGVHGHYGMTTPAAPTEQPDVDAAAEEPAPVISGSGVLGADLRNEEESLGRIEDLAIDLDDLTVEFAVVRSEDLHAVTFDPGAMDVAAGQLFVAVDRQTFEASPTLDENHWVSHKVSPISG